MMPYIMRISKHEAEKVRKFAAELARLKLLLKYDAKRRKKRCKAIQREGVRVW